MTLITPIVLISKKIRLMSMNNVEVFAGYEMLSKYVRLITPTKTDVLGREEQIKHLTATLSRYEVTNACLIGPAGVGKTALVRQFAKDHKDWLCCEVDLALMSSSDGGKTDGSVEMASRLKQLVNEVQDYQSKHDDPLLIFMDEFHLIANISTAALQAIKPLLADSGARGIHLVMATTSEEYNEYIRSDDALDQRIQQIIVTSLPDDVTVQVLRDFKKAYAPNTYVPDALYRMIVDFTNRYLPAQAQPRKSKLILDNLLGWNKAYNVPINRELLCKVIYESSGFNIDVNVDIKHSKDYLSNRVFGQDQAIDFLLQQLYLTASDLNDMTKPKFTTLFTGPTGVGKTELAKAFTELMFGSESAMIRFDMSEYSTPESVPVLRERLTAEVWKQPYSVILLDEIEKAHTTATRLLLQVLDDARLTDQHGRQVAFNNTYIIITTNVAHEVYANMAGFKDLGKSKSDAAELSKLIRRALIADDSFSPELVNRLDSFVPFGALHEAEFERIVLNMLSRLKKLVYDKYQVTLVFDKTVKDYFVEETVDDSTDGGGGRGIKRRMYSDLFAEVGRVLLLEPDAKQLIATTKGTFKSKNKTINRSTAHIVVGKLKQR